MGPRVMYLHGLQGGGKNTSVRQALLEQAVGRENVVVPSLMTRRILLIYSICLSIFLAMLGVIAVTAIINWALIPTIFLMIILTLIGVFTYIVTGRGVTYYLVQTAVRRAEKEFKRFRPNVIVTSSFGAVVALNMRNTAKVALVMLAPGQDNYCRYMRISEMPSIAAYPYVIIVHGTCDTEVSLDDSVRLVDSIGFGSCKLELIDDYHNLSTLSAADFREFADEAYNQGRNAILQLQSHEKMKLIGPTKLDPVLFDLLPGGVLPETATAVAEGNSGFPVPSDAAMDAGANKVAPAAAPASPPPSPSHLEAEAERAFERMTQPLSSDAAEPPTAAAQQPENVSIPVSPDDETLS